MNNKKTIFCIVGPSGSGKTTAVEFASKALGIPVLRSYTTRPMREGEVNGIDHIFVSEKDVPKRSEMLAYTIFGNYQYWTSVRQIDNAQSHVLYVIDEVGLEEMEYRFGNVYEMVAIYIKPSQSLISQVDLERSMRDKERLRLPESRYDHIIHNDSTLEKFLFNFTQIIWQHKL